MNKSLLIVTLAACLGSAHATKPTEFVQLNEGHFAAIGEDGRVIEVATSEHIKAQFNKEVTADYAADTRQSITAANMKSPDIDATLCGAYWASQEIAQDGPVIMNDTITLSGTARVWFGVGPVPPSPTFAYTRTKAKLKSYFADGTLAERDYQIDRDPVENGTSVVVTDSNNQILFAEYSRSDAQAQVSAKGVHSFNWVARSEIIVDNPVSDNGSVPQDQDCYDSISIREFNTVHL